MKLLVFVFYMGLHEQTDIWSLGCCMYEIATKTTPFSGWTEQELRGNVTKQKVSYIITLTHLTIYSVLPNNKYTKQ